MVMFHWSYLTVLLLYFKYMNSPALTDLLACFSQVLRLKTNVVDLFWRLGMATVIDFGVFLHKTMNFCTMWVMICI